MTDVTSAATHLRDSVQYGHLWITAECREWFAEEHRLRSWLRIYAAVAEVQADLGRLPLEAAERIGEVAADTPLDLPAIAEATRRTGHSTAGLVDWLRHAVGPEAAPHVGLGVTVQDISDTWTSLTLRHTGNLVGADLRALLDALTVLADRFRATPMAARTHGQIGVPITVGFKVAQWAAECERHLDRLEEGRQRWETAPLSGSVGSLGYWGAEGPELLEAFGGCLGLAAPPLPWGSSRDAVAEFACWAQLVAGLLARIGNEVFQLQRTEIGELAEPAHPEQISSITMPHKRNPELSEHLVTLRHLVGSSAGLLLTATLVEHERDGRAWKTEWVALPDLCCALAKAARAAAELVAGLHVNTARMAENLARSGSAATSEQVVNLLAESLGRDEAFAVVRSAVARSRPGRSWLAEIDADDRVRDTGLAFDGADVGDRALASAVAFVDRWRQGRG
ncbi:adenylosuccinate lyase [Actinomycetospora sp. NBRC 106375]|uniref:lyase family protein n=1 Tax=Actinomycetospora sp. NBRC 106375 TaxID=3032207 RepID=UPI0024A5C841|nr:lyase family protein [Actinomycetospora sp. NBRC 106375]GLZ49334.1 adenylosuccinate lyase [Actinomycetospora sp. NBRC 106375]